MNQTFNHCHLLYVDDEINNLVSFKATFRQHYMVHIAQSAQEGLELLKNNPVQTIITDQRMPEVTGVQFLEQVIVLDPDPIRMILTGFSDIADIIQAINTGQVFRYITKPWDYHELKMTIDNAMQMFLLKQANKQLMADLQGKVDRQSEIIEVFKPFVPADIAAKWIVA